jgi:hypothetical protein
MRLPNFQPLVLRVSRWLLVQGLRPEIRDRLRGVFKLADQTVPKALAEGAGPLVVDGLLVQAVTKVTGVKPTSAEAQIISALFDVVASAAAQRLIRQ